MSSFRVQIGGVDGEHNVTMEAPRVESILDFLMKHDHEGSSVSLQISADSEDAYDLLDVIKTYARKRDS